MFLEHGDSYNLKVKMSFSSPVNVGGRIIWNGQDSLEKVKNIVHNKKAVHLTRYAYCQKGGFFDQNPEAYPVGSIPRKKDMPAEKYGGYTGVNTTVFSLVQYSSGKKCQTMFLPIELYHKDEFVIDYGHTCEYVRKCVDLNASDIQFPLASRYIKMNTMFEIDGIRLYITGGSVKDGRASFCLAEPLIVGYKWEKYIKHLDNFWEKKKNMPSLVYSVAYDKISKDDNVNRMIFC